MSVWNHVSIRLDVSNMHLFWCKLSWMGPWGLHRIASSEDIPRQGPHPSGTLENNRLCPLTDCWQHASHFLKHMESCLQKNHQAKTKKSVYGFLNSALMEQNIYTRFNVHTQIILVITLNLQCSTQKHTLTTVQNKKSSMAKWSKLNRLGFGPPQFSTS